MLVFTISMQPSRESMQVQNHHWRKEARTAERWRTRSQAAGRCRRCRGNLGSIMDYYEQLNISRSASKAVIPAQFEGEFEPATALLEQVSRRAEDEARRQHLQTIGDTLLKSGTRARYDAYLLSLANPDNTRRTGFALPDAAGTRVGGVNRAGRASAYCCECGQLVRATARFCSTCGTKLESIAPLPHRQRSN